MTQKINPIDVRKRVKTGGGRTVILLDRLAKEYLYGKLECARNIYIVDGSENVIWQVKTNFDADGSPFTNIEMKGSVLVAYRWDGGTYNIDLNTGFGVPSHLLK